jgi:molybdopterin/thiamine biosynthesis adenylyltransferase
VKEAFPYLLRDRLMGRSQSRSEARIRNGKVLIVGVGGLGCPAALALTRVGIGTIGLIDPDVVELSNLQRQILHSTPDIGRPKVLSAQEKLIRVNPEVSVIVHQDRLHEKNLSSLFRSYDFIIDGTDGVTTKFLINDGAVLTNTPFSYAGIFQFQGQLLTVLPRQTTCLRCLFPQVPPVDDIPTCQESGIIGSLAGSIGTLQALEAIKYFRGDEPLLTDRLLTYDALASHWREVQVRRSRHCPLCGEKPTIKTVQLTEDATSTVCTPGA